MEKGEALLCSWARFGQAQPAALGLAAHCRKRAGGGHWPVDPENASDKGGGWGRHPRARGGGGEPISGGSGVRSSPDEVLLGGTRGQKGNQRQELGS
jgi:hypothetical protein